MTDREGAFADSPVPEALPRILAEARERVGPERMDRLWIFPPLVKGRKEWGLVTLSLFTVHAGGRTLMSARYAAQLTGGGMEFESRFAEEGTAPADRLPRVMDGVVRRSDLPLEEPREYEVAGDAGRFRALLKEYEVQETGPRGPGTSS